MDRREFAKVGAAACLAPSGSSKTFDSGFDLVVYDVVCGWPDASTGWPNTSTGKNSLRFVFEDDHQCNFVEFLDSRNNIIHFKGSFYFKKGDVLTAKWTGEDIDWKVNGKRQIHMARLEGN